MLLTLGRRSGARRRRTARPPLGVDGQAKALADEPHVGLLMPCNVVVQEVDEGCTVSIIDPRQSSPPWWGG